MTPGESPCALDPASKVVQRHLSSPLPPRLGYARSTRAAEARWPHQGDVTTLKSRAEAAWPGQEIEEIGVVTRWLM